MAHNTTDDLSIISMPGEPTDDEIEAHHRKLRNFRRNDPKLFEEYVQLPIYHDQMTVRCPTRNRDGSEIAEGDLRGCGSTNVHYDGDVYDCYDCGIFFSDYAADPPHRRCGYQMAVDPTVKKVFVFDVYDNDGFRGSLRQKAHSREEAEQECREYLRRNEVAPNGSLDDQFELRPSSQHKEQIQ